MIYLVVGNGIGIEKKSMFILGAFSTFPKFDLFSEWNLI